MEEVFSVLRKFLFNLKHGTEHLNYGRDIISSWAKKYAGTRGEIRILDLGAGQGADIANIRKTLPDTKLEAYGIELHEPYVREAGEKGIHIFPVNLENEPIPLEAGSIDIIIANQILEHIKEIFWVCSEVSRVLKAGGVAFIGVPNLAALHNRFALLLGEQPTSIELLSEHVRGFTKPGFSRFITRGGYFRILEFRGSNFYPFPPAISPLLSRLFPSLSVSLFFCVQRAGKDGSFMEVLKSDFHETPFFAGK